MCYQTVAPDVLLKAGDHSEITYAEYDAQRVAYALNEPVRRFYEDAVAQDRRRYHELVERGLDLPGFCPVSYEEFVKSRFFTVYVAVEIPDL